MENNNLKEKNNRNKTINWITKVGIFAALSSILYYVPKFNLPFIFPSFLEIQFSNLPAILGGFILGPFGGAIILIIRTLFKLPASHTGCVGELADLVIGLMVVIPSSIIYRKLHSKKGGIISLIVACIGWVVSAVLANWLFLVNFYANFYQGGMDTLVNACQTVIPSITSENFMGKYLTFAVIPFNLLLSVIVCLVTFFVYKRLSNVFKKDFFQHHK